MDFAGAASGAFTTAGGFPVFAGAACGAFEVARGASAPLFIAFVSVYASASASGTDLPRTCAGLAPELVDFLHGAGIVLFASLSVPR